MSIKIGTDGSGVRETITGCPFCDSAGTENMRWKISTWWIDPNMDNGRYAFEIKNCPLCGEKLPNLEGWSVIDAIEGEETIKTFKTGTVYLESGYYDFEELKERLNQSDKERRNALANSIKQSK